MRWLMLGCWLWFCISWITRNSRLPNDPRITTPPPNRSTIMAIRVTTTSSDAPDRSFKEGTGWHVDDRGYLHVTKAGDGNLATFHAGSWNAIERINDTPNTTVVNIHSTGDPVATANEITKRLGKLNA